jgi:hypothetical protein
MNEGTHIRLPGFGSLCNQVKSLYDYWMLGREADCDGL